MPKIGQEVVRRAALVEATVEVIGAAGSLDVTVGQIAKRAGMSTALAHHYFGSKEAIFLAAMRHVLTVYGAEVRGALAAARSPAERARAVIRASFTQASFRREVVAAWLNFYVLAQSSEEARRLLSVYHRRLHSNLTHDLRALVGDRAADVAQRLGGLIDGIYLRFAVNPGDTTGPDAAAHVLASLDAELGV